MLIVVVSGDHFAHVPREQPVLAQQVLKRLDVSDRIAQRVEAALRPCRSCQFIDVAKLLVSLM
jgi:hypothetical protein